MVEQRPEPQVNETHISVINTTWFRACRPVNDSCYFLTTQTSPLVFCSTGPPSLSFRRTTVFSCRPAAAFGSGAALLWVHWRVGPTAWGHGETDGCLHGSARECLFGPNAPGERAWFWEEQFLMIINQKYFTPNTQFCCNINKLCCIKCSIVNIKKRFMLVFKFQ